MVLVTKMCLSCGVFLQGRSDKKFCDPHCKSAYHYKKSQEQQPKFYNQVDKQLKLNRKLLKTYNKSGKAEIRAQLLFEKGFNPNFFTHYWESARGYKYRFVFEFGFLKHISNGKEKFVLIVWQEYMQKSVKL